MSKYNWLIRSTLHAILLHTDSSEAASVRSTTFVCLGQCIRLSLERGKLSSSNNSSTYIAPLLKVPPVRAGEFFCYMDCYCSSHRLSYPHRDRFYCVAPSDASFWCSNLQWWIRSSPEMMRIKRRFMKRKVQNNLYRENKSHASSSEHVRCLKLQWENRLFTQNERTFT
jgi:hypothetical protein